MTKALYTNASNENRKPCTHHADHAISWQDDLPAGLKDLVIPPVSFEVVRDYEMLADHSQGCDAARQPCFGEFRYVLTQLRSDDHEVFYDAAVYAESLTSWCLIDQRWLVCRTTANDFDPSQTRTHLSISNIMPH